MKVLRRFSETLEQTFEALDKTLLLAIATFLGIGLVQVYSSSFIFAVETRGDGLFFFKKQLLYAAVGIMVLIITICTPFELIKKGARLFWWAGTFLILLTLIPGIGKRAGGAARWLEILPGIRFEPGELMKVGLCLLLASWLGQQEEEPFQHSVARSKSLFARRALTLLIPAALLLKQPDFGTFVILSSVAVAVAFAFGLKWRYLTVSFGIFGAVASVLISTSPYRLARVKAFLDPWADPEKTGFQVIQSLLSFHTGGFSGVGLGQGQGKLFFLPEAHTDFTLAVLGEEMGFVGFMAVLLLYFFMVYRGFQIALRTEDKFIRALVLGLTLTFAFSVVINMGVVLGLFPPKGLTLPFLSYGGSSLIVTCFMFGLILNSDLHIQKTTRQRRVFFRLMN